MEISSVNSNSYALYPLDDISADNIVINENPNNFNENLTSSINSASNLESPATAVAINPIQPESIALQELQSNIISEFDRLRDGEISRDDFSSSLEDLGIDINQQQIQQSSSNDAQNNEPILDLTSALIESVRGNTNESTGIDLSSYAAAMDLVNEQTQNPSVNEQLQAYTQNLRN